MTLCVYKDSCFARMFGASNPATAATTTVPKVSYAFFASRDSLTIFASFNLPPLIAPHLDRLIFAEAGGANAAQFLAPALMQLFSTPLHLLGLDLYNRQAKLGSRERFARVRRDWAVSAFARMGRIVPAFGVGGVVNAGVRRRLMERIHSGMVS